MRFILTAAAAAALMAGPAMAQSAATQGEHGRQDGVREQRFAEHRERRAEDLKLILRIRPDQEAAWAAYQQARQMRPQREEQRPDRDATTPARLATMEQRMAEREAAMHARIRATLDFYAALTPEQQKTFDALRRLHGPGRMHPPHFGPPGGHDGGGPRS